MTTCTKCGAEFYSLWDGPAPFRRWLNALPQDKPIRCGNARWEPWLLWLRRVSDPKAQMVRNADGEYQEYRLHGVVDEVPGTFFYAYCLYFPRTMTAAEYIVAFDTSLAECGYDDRKEYWEEFGVSREAVERMAVWP